MSKRSHLVTLLLALFLIILSSQTIAAEHTVMMKNSGADGVMVFEPAVLYVAVGDTIHFEPTDFAHSTESIEALKPAGSVSWKSQLSKTISVTIDKEGVYVYQCEPHLVMAMIGVIVAGEPLNLAEVKAKSVSLTERFAMNKSRLHDYLDQIK